MSLDRVPQTAVRLDSIAQPVRGQAMSVAGGLVVLVRVIGDVVVRSSAVGGSVLRQLPLAP